MQSNAQSLNTQLEGLSKPMFVVPALAGLEVVVGKIVEEDSRMQFTAYGRRSTREGAQLDWEFSLGRICVIEF